MNEKRFERVIERKHSQYDVGNLIFNLIITIMSALAVLITSTLTSKIVLGVIIFFDLFYFGIMLLDMKVYWREIK